MIYISLIYLKLTLTRLGFLRVVFSRWEGSMWPPFIFSRRTNLIAIQLFTIVKQSI